MQFKLCPDLQPSDVRRVVEQDRNDGYERRFHEHVPRDRLADAARVGSATVAWSDHVFVRKQFRLPQVTTT